MAESLPVTTSSLKRLFRTSEAATLCHLTRKTILELIERGEIEAVIVPAKKRSRRLIPYQNLRAYMERTGYPLDDIDRAAGVESRKKILIIEDEKHYGDLVKQYFERDRRITVELAYTGARGVALIADFQPDLLLLDLRLPDLHGSEVLEAVEGLKPLKEARILVHSAHIKPEFKKRLEELGVEAFVPKGDTLNGLKDKAYKMMGIDRRDSGRMPTAQRPDTVDTNGNHTG